MNEHTRFSLQQYTKKFSNDCTICGYSAVNTLIWQWLRDDPPGYIQLYNHHTKTAIEMCNFAHHGEYKVNMNLLGRGLLNTITMQIVFLPGLDDLYMWEGTLQQEASVMALKKAIYQPCYINLMYPCRFQCLRCLRC